MNFQSTTNIGKRSALILGSAFIFALSGCSKAEAPAALAKAKTPASHIAPKAPAKVDEAKVAAPRSSFVVDATLRDPFYPKSKRVKQAAAAKAEAVAIDLPRVLESEFQGVIGTGEQRIALISNVLLEPGRSAVIPIRSAGREQKVPVFCTEVTQRSVVLQVEGYPQPLTISRLQNP